MIIILSMFLQSTGVTEHSDIADMVVQATVGVAVAQFIVGLFLLVGWYYVQRRFVSHEFPGIIERMTQQIQSLETSLRADIAGIRFDINGIRSDMSTQGRQLERHDERFRHQGERINRLEGRVDSSHERRWEDGERRREREREALDDTRTGR